MSRGMMARYVCAIDSVDVTSPLPRPFSFRKRSEDRAYCLASQRLSSVVNHQENIESLTLFVERLLGRGLDPVEKIEVREILTEVNSRFESPCMSDFAKVCGERSREQNAGLAKLLSGSFQTMKEITTFFSIKANTADTATSKEIILQRTVDPIIKLLNGIPNEREPIFFVASNKVELTAFQRLFLDELISHFLGQSGQIESD